MKTMAAEIPSGNFPTSTAPELNSMAAARTRTPEHPFGRPMGFLGNRFVYAVISQRAHGLSIGINMNPDRHCNFDCAYCEIDRTLPARDSKVDQDVLAVELETLLTLTFQHRLRELP